MALYTQLFHRESGWCLLMREYIWLQSDSIINKIVSRMHQKLYRTLDLVNRQLKLKYIELNMLRFPQKNYVRFVFISGCL